MRDVAGAVYHALGKVWGEHCPRALLLCVSHAGTVSSKHKVVVEQLFSGAAAVVAQGGGGVHSAASDSGDGWWGCLAAPLPPSVPVLPIWWCAGSSVAGRGRCGLERLATVGGGGYAPLDPPTLWS